MKKNQFLALLVAGSMLMAAIPLHTLADDEILVLDDAISAEEFMQEEPILLDDYVDELSGSEVSDIEDIPEISDVIPQEGQSAGELELPMENVIAAHSVIA